MLGKSSTCGAAAHTLGAYSNVSQETIGGGMREKEQRMEGNKRQQQLADEPFKSFYIKWRGQKATTNGGRTFQISHQAVS